MWGSPQVAPLQFTGGLGGRMLHVPVTQMAWALGLLGTMQGVPSAWAVYEQPLAARHTGPSWHGDAGAQKSAPLPVHTPAWQVSVWVQASWSSQAVPSGCPAQGPGT